MSNQSQPFLIFTIGDQRYALSIENVVEVASMVELLKMPTEHPEIAGIANRHGIPLLMLDLRQVFGQTDMVITSNTLFVVAQSKTEQMMGLVVDKIHQVEYVGQAQLNFTAKAGKYIRGIINSNNILTQVIDIETLLQTYFSDTVVDEDMFKV